MAKTVEHCLLVASLCGGMYAAVQLQDTKGELYHHPSYQKAELLAQAKLDVMEAVWNLSYSPPRTTGMVYHPTHYPHPRWAKSLLRDARNKEPTLTRLESIANKLPDEGMITIIDGKPVDRTVFFNEREALNRVIEELVSKEEEKRRDVMPLEERRKWYMTELLFAGFLFGAILAADACMRKKVYYY